MGDRSTTESSVRETQSKTTETQGASYLSSQIALANLEEPFTAYRHLVDGPADHLCLVPIARNLLNAFQTNPWAVELPAFLGWPELMQWISDHANELTKAVGSQVFPELRFSKDGQLPINPLYGSIHTHPLAAMLLTSQQIEHLQPQFRGLQLHVINARFIELNKARKVEIGANANGTAEGFPNFSGSRWVPKQVHAVARAVRDLSGARFAELLDLMNPQLPPMEFFKNLDSITPPLGRGNVQRMNLISNYCQVKHGGRPGGTRIPGERQGFTRGYPDYIDYGNWRFGIQIGPPEDEQNSGTLKQEAVFERSINEVDALRLGLDPLELADGDPIQLSQLEEGETPGDAREIARSHTRSYEIDRSLFWWSANSLAVEEFQHGILPSLRAALHESSTSMEDLGAATAVAISVDTGRSLERVFDVRIENPPKSEFAFEVPREDVGAGHWHWWAIGPVYRAELPLPPELEVPRATALRHTASQLVTELIAKYCRKKHIRAGILFRRGTDWASVTKSWLEKHDHAKRFTSARLARLRWNILHQLTGGELASACLTLGLFQPQARVELHYAILDVAEAARLFRQSTRLLWEDNLTSETEAAEGPIHSENNKIIGCRAFPKPTLVKDVVRWLQEGSRKFFSLRVQHFRIDKHAEILNRAVLYLVWHQMFSFATRAIRDAYRSKSGFASESGIGAFGDKDFEDHRKTRMIWAEELLLGHMNMVEQRLSSIADAHLFTVPDSPVWFIRPDAGIVSVTPGSIEQVFGSRFPFPVNTPRKVMRNMLRTNGMRHEYAETFMGHWWQGREPYSPWSSFHWGEFLEEVQRLVPKCLMELGFDRFPGGIQR